jgi:hypothetical protein
MEMRQAEQKSRMKTVLIVLLLLGYPLLIGTYFIIGNSKGTVASNQTALETCQQPFKNEQDSANIDIQHVGVGEDTKPIYKALTDSANGLKACQDKYGN